MLIGFCSRMNSDLIDDCRCQCGLPVCIVVVIHYTPGSRYLLAQDCVKGSRVAIEILEDRATDQWLKQLTRAAAALRLIVGRSAVC